MANKAVFAGSSTPVTVIPSGTPLGYQKITGLSTVKTLTVPDGATYALVTPSAQGVRWRDDGQDPTGTDGMPIAANAAPVPLANLAELKFIEQAASATLNVSYYK